MQAVETERSAPFGETIHTGEALVTSLLKPAREPIEVIFDLWAWSSGLRSFLIAYDRSIGESDKPSAVTRNRTPEFQLTNAALTRLAGLLAELDRIPPSEISAIVDLSEKDMNGFVSFVHDMSIGTELWPKARNSALPNGRHGRTGLRKRSSNRSV